MRYTLSVLTAVCLLAMGQPAWSQSLDHELRQRARQAALALPDHARTHAARLLLELQATSQTSRRAIGLSSIASAAQSALEQLYGTRMGHQQLMPAGVDLHWSKPAPQDLYDRPALELDPQMVQQWTQALAATCTETDNNNQISL